VVQGALDSIRRAGDYLQREGLSNPLAFRLRRLASWSIVDAIPPATDGRTIVPPPDPNVRNMLTELQDKGDWQALVEASEEKVSECIFWLDLNRFVAEGLNGLGGPYQDARNAVSQETAFFLLRLPGIENLSFSDGSPFADADTRQWLKSIGLGAGAASGQPGPSAGTGEGDRMAEAVRKAEELAKKKLPEAVSSVQQELRSSFAKRDQLLWRMALSRILVKAKKVELALPHLEAILCDIDLYRLEEWDPDLAVKGLRMVWSGFSTQSDESSRERAADVLNRLAKLDPAGVLSL
jgi:type VI secretion system protein VasJ